MVARIRDAPDARPDPLEMQSLRDREMVPASARAPGLSEELHQGRAPQLDQGEEVPFVQIQMQEL